jgi:ArsR family transcriptional regulator, lead/cadmium/zinc/bismuth-responsive transcriptional repressor
MSKSANKPECSPADHGRKPAAQSVSSAALERAAQICRALGDAARLRILDLLRQDEMCVTEIVAALNDKFSTVSQRLRLLRSEGLVVRRRQGVRLFYQLADRHVVDLLTNALEHAREPAPSAPHVHKEK